MALFPPAYSYSMDFEDRSRQYKTVPDACPRGCAGPCYAISGINSGAFPRQFAAIDALPQAQRGGAVAEFYETEFWPRFAVLDSQDLANRVYDEAVNNGPGTAVETLQRAVNAAAGAWLAVDGVLGPQTAHAANVCDPAALLAALRAERLALVDRVLAERPDLEADRAELEARASA